MNARGYSVYTTKGRTNSDTLAEILMKQFKASFPELKARTDISDGDLDTEENFTVIVKTNCPSVLIEWNFQDNHDDVAILMSDVYNARLVESLMIAINKANEILG
jgi:N-acetylmuramoyl-L-alanine amidase